MIKVGIFWVIDSEIYMYNEQRYVEQLSEREKLTGKIDTELAHYQTWDKELASKYPNADFATYPRGRILFDIKENRHIIYADKCITLKQIAQIESFYQTVNAEICQDEHYRCDICMKTQLPELSVCEYPDSYKLILITKTDSLLRTLHKDNDEMIEFDFGDILDVILPELGNDDNTCKFLVGEEPSKEFSQFFEKHSCITPLYVIKDKIEYNILDGQSRIGANLIELSCNGRNYLIECGTELEQTEHGTNLRKQLLDKHYDACFVSHYHADHAGLLSEPLNCNSIYMGEATFAILQTINAICKENIDKIITFSNQAQIELNGMTIVPYLCDHSAYDSYMLYFKSRVNSILYTGDFRSNGRKSFGALLRRLPQKVDTLICEGTNLELTKPLLTEQELENKLIEICNNDKPVFVLQSATNIDRIVSVYRSAIRSNRIFIMRLVQADICCNLPNIPQPRTFKKCLAYAQTGMDNDKHKHYVDKYGKNFVGRDFISKINNYILEVTSKDLHYIQKLAQMCDLQGSKLVYSTWTGYKKEQSMKTFLDGIKELGIEIVDLHASGHASKADIDTLKKTVKADNFVIIHTSLQKDKTHERI